MEINDIKLWLEDPEYYYDGVKLYEKYCLGSFLSTLFRMGEDDYNRSKLITELTALVQQQEKVEVVQKDTYPKELRTELEKAQSLMDERSDLKSQLRKSWRDGEPKEKRQPMALRILAIKGEIDHIYATEKYFKKMKSLPKDDFDIDDEIAALMKRLTTVRTYVSRYKNKPNSDKHHQYNDEHFQLIEKLRVLGITFQD